MNSICYDGSNCVFAFLQYHQEVFLCLCIIHPHCKLVIQLGNALRMHILQPTVQHQMNQIVYDFSVIT